MLLLRNVQDLVIEVSMRLLPIMNSNRSFVNKNNFAQKKSNSISKNENNNKHAHRYTGVASADLAYASMFDSAIARDLKLMGLI